MLLGRGKHMQVEEFDNEANLMNPVHFEAGPRSEELGFKRITSNI
jgi:hypothetical protein